MKYWTPKFHQGQHVDVLLGDQPETTPGVVWCVWPTLVEVITETAGGTRVHILDVGRVLAAKPAGREAHRYVRR